MGAKAPSSESRRYVSGEIGSPLARSPCCVSHPVMSKSQQSYGLESARLLHPQDSPGKNTRVGCHFLLQGIFLTQGSNLGLTTEPLQSEPPGMHHVKGNAQTFLRRLVTLAFSFTQSNLPPKYLQFGYSPVRTGFSCHSVSPYKYSPE